MGDKVDIYSDEIDPCVTIETIDNLSFGKLFPRIQGIATANYAHQRNPKLPLKEAVAEYIQHLKDEKKNPEVPYVHIPSTAPEFIKKYGRVRVVDSDSDREGRFVCLVSKRSQWNRDEEAKQNNEPDKPPRVVFVDYEFVIKNIYEARKLTSKVLRDARIAHPRTTINGIHYAGDCALITRHDKGTGIRKGTRYVRLRTVEGYALRPRKGAAVSNPK